MLVLFETSYGYAIFKLLDEKKITQSENLYEDFSSPESACKILKLKHFEKFANVTEALIATTALREGRISKSLKKALQTHVTDIQEKLVVCDAKLGSAIKEKLNLQCLSGSKVQELFRCIRTQSDALIAGIGKKELKAMSLGLAHSLSRYSLKHNPDKVDVLIVQSVMLLDDLDKELNNYIMRCREWYGWHFPELGKIVTDNIQYVETILLIGSRDKTATTDLSDILSEEVEQQVKQAAETSVGTQISDDDIEAILVLGREVLSLSKYRTELHDYLKLRMMAIAPNLSVLVGELVGARLIAHAGSLINLAKHPASTVQIIGAEKAFFRALKTKHDTPKYGLIYHSSLIGQASAKNKGKMSRMLAAKAALATRVDALSDKDDKSKCPDELGAAHKARLEQRLRELEEGEVKRGLIGPKKAKLQKYHSAKSEVPQYPVAMDSTLPGKRIKEENEGDTPKKKVKKEEDGQEDDSQIEKKKKKKKKKTEGDQSTLDETADSVEQSDISNAGEKKKKKKKGKQGEDTSLKEESPKKKKQEEAEEAQAVETVGKKKKKKKSEDGQWSGDGTSQIDESQLTETSQLEDGEKKKKKKKRKMEESQTTEADATLEEEDSSKIKKKKKKKKGAEDTNV